MRRTFDAANHQRQRDCHAARCDRPARRRDGEALEPPYSGQCPAFRTIIDAGIAGIHPGETMETLTRFSVAPLATMTRRLADVASGRMPPDLVITGARLLSTYSERILDGRELWVAGGRIAAIQPAGAHKKAGNGKTEV